MGALLNFGKDARRAAEASRRSQEIANNRQLSVSQAEETRVGSTRRVPRGRRLYSTDAAQKSNLS